ncbi:MAG: dihydroxy-acid dehydratase, partial [Pseudomonadota bacterium]
FINPGTPLRDALTQEATYQALNITHLGNDFRPAAYVLDERAFVNGIVGLMATGGSTNLVLHLPAMARAAGVILEMEDFAAISDIVPLIAKVYPNGLADVNHFHAAGGLGYAIRTLLDAGLLHDDVTTIAGDGLELYTQEPFMHHGFAYREGPKKSHNEKILRPASDPFAKTGGLKHVTGNLGDGVIKLSAVANHLHVVEAPAAVFHTQEDVKDAFQKGDLNRDVIVVVRYQGPSANGMPELHNLTPYLSVLLDRGHKVALVTDGRMSGASGKVPAAIHVAPEAATGGPIAKIKDGDILRLDAVSGQLDNLTDGWDSRNIDPPDLTHNGFGIGRELFTPFRQIVGPATSGAGVVV